MRDHTKLRVFAEADELALEIYRASKHFPRDERFGLTNQLRRAAVSIPSNIVEGCSRRSESEYVRFLEIAYGSLREAEYQLSLAFRLGYLEEADHMALAKRCDRTSRMLNTLISTLAHKQ